MKLILEKGFIEQFEIDILNPSKYLKNRSLIRLWELFGTYAEYEVFTDVPIESVLNYPTFRRINNYCTAIYNLDSFQDIIAESKIGNQALAFCQSDNPWREFYEEMGGLYFKVSDYIEKMESILSIEMEIRLANYNDEFKWNIIEPCALLPYNSLLLIDSYVLSKPKIVKNNLIKILKLFTENQNQKQTQKSVFTILSSSGDKQNIGFSDEVVGIIQEIIAENKSSIETNLIAIYPKSMDKMALHNFRIHDRYLFGNYFSVFAPSGFELLPLKKDEKNDTKIFVKSIFSKTMYDDFREFIPVYQSYIRWVNGTEKANYKVPFL